MSVSCLLYFLLALYAFVEIQSNIFTGLHVDDAEVTLNICLASEFSGGELFFRGARCEEHIMSEIQPGVCLQPYCYGKIIFRMNNLYLTTLIYSIYLNSVLNLK